MNTTHYNYCALKTFTSYKRPNTTPPEAENCSYLQSDGYISTMAAENWSYWKFTLDVWWDAITARAERC